MTYLLYEIEALRDDLNNKIAQSTDGLTSKEIVKLSQRLDQLIARYLIHNG
ncbi:MAG: aspartyl-phosphate phosphatase Spo0E family protein [Tissierellia bacterium]|nr:aspartyl-phosphate phosphatase Spo0E family protein [Tissierellia bacterium]